MLGLKNNNVFAFQKWKGNQCLRWCHWVNTITKKIQLLSVKYERLQMISSFRSAAIVNDSV